MWILGHFLRAEQHFCIKSGNARGRSSNDSSVSDGGGKEGGHGDDCGLQAA